MWTIPRFYLYNNSKLPTNLSEYYSNEGLQLSIEKSQLFLFKPQKLVNPFTGQLTSSVDLDNAKSGEVTYFHETLFNHVDRSLAIEWNEHIDADEIKWLELIQENGSLLAFCQPSPGDDVKLGGFGSNKNLHALFPNSIFLSYFKWNLLDTQTDNTTWLEYNQRCNADIVGNLCGQSYEENEEIASFDEIILEPTIQTSSLKPSERWLAVKEELLKQLKPEEQEPIVKNTTDKYFFNIDSVFQYVFPALISKNASISINPLDVFDKEISIAKTPILIELPKNPYTKKPIKTTPLDKPIPGSITYLLDKTADGKQRAMLMVWNYRIDNEEMKWLLLFEKNGGLMNFCWDTQAYDWKISPDLFKTLFTSANSVHFYTYPPNTTTPEAK